jgi:hypothetical protein
MAARGEQLGDRKRVSRIGPVVEGERELARARGGRRGRAEQP